MLSYFRGYYFLLLNSFSNSLLFLLISLSSVLEKELPDIKDLGLIDNKSENRLNPQVTDLQCGHRFHDDCIKDWMKKENTCPTCRCNIDPESTNENFSKNLVEVQTYNYPSIRDINFIILANNISWNLPVNNNIEYNSGCSYSSVLSE